MSAEPAGAIWIEVLSRQHEVASRQRFASAPITIGRAYDNDVVVDDPHVAAHHLRIVRDDAGALVAEDLGSRNGLHVDRESERRAIVVLDGEQVLRVGTTLLRVRTAAFAVAPEEPLQRAARYWPAAIACIVGVYALAALDLWLSETGEAKAIRYFTPLLILTVIVGVWTAAWAVVTRVFRGHARFGRHFLIAAGGLFAFSLYDQAAEIGAFAWSFTSLATTAYVAGWLLLGAMCYAHLVAIHRVRRPLKLAIAVVVAAAGIAMQTLKHNETRANYGQPVTLSRLEPPALRMVTPQRESAFFTDAAGLRETLDKARTEEPTGGDTAPDDD
jgi:hypothetical protein